jgi:asparagine synthase (glutamine-hydrolysing)
MCGITGWVDFSADLTAERDTVEAMTATMSLRGPDAGGVWLAPHAALGHRRLAVIDVEGGVQPMSAAEGDVVLTYSGEVYNYRELRRELEAAGQQFRTASDTEVVLRAYLEWGMDFLERLNGMYAFAIWDGRSEELLLVRDRLGVKPLFYYPLADGLLFGSEPKAILANPRAARKADKQGICSVLMPVRRLGFTPFQGLLELRGGHCLKLSRSGTTLQRYWELEARPHEDDLPTTVARVRELLEDIVPRQLISDVPLCILLSGGLDSSALVGLGKQVEGAGESLRTFAVDFDAETFTGSPMELHSSRDSPFAEDVARHVGVNHQSIPLDAEALLSPDARHSVLVAQDSPVHAADADISLYLLSHAIREHSTVAVSGEAADEVFGGYPWMHDETVLAMPLFPWMGAALKAEPEAAGEMGSEVMQRLGLFEYVFEQHSESLAEVPHLDDEDPKEHRMREVMHQHLMRFLPYLLDRKDRTSMAAGLEVRVPYCDHRLVEYVFNIPWSMKTFDGREKSVLREATKDLLPSSVLERTKSGFPISQDQRYDERLRAEMARIVDDPDDPLREIFGDDMSPTAGESSNGFSYMRRGRLEGIVRLSEWFKEYDVEFVDA